MTPAQHVLQSTERHVSSERLWQSLMALARLGAPDVRRHPVENTVLQQLRLAHMTEQIRQVGVLT